MSVRAEGALGAFAWGQALSAGRVLTVTELTQRVRARLADDPRLQHVAVAGEMSSFKRHTASGHLYFYLKDARSRLACVMWRAAAEGLEFEPHDGMQVVAVGDVDVYPAQGLYQLYIRALYPVGPGLLYARLQQLARRLSAEGLFDPARKRAIPRWPRAVGLVTSPDGAALRDVVAVVRRRSPRTPLYFSPARVQGDGAAERVVAALERLAGWPGVEVIIVARGGGAADELWTFNHEEVVRAIARCRVPVISAVGHEIDVTLADLAADARAPTPSAAAELATPDEEATAREVRELKGRLRRALTARLDRLEQATRRLAGHWALARPERWLAGLRQRVDELALRARSAMRERLSAPRLALSQLAARLSAADPLAVLERGYALVTDERSGAAVRRVEGVCVGAALRVQMWDGRLGCRVERVERGRPPGVESSGDGEWGRV